MQGMDRWSKQYLDNTLGMNYCLTAGATRHPKAQWHLLGGWGTQFTLYSLLVPGGWVGSVVYREIAPISSFILQVCVVGTHVHLPNKERECNS